MKVWKENWIQDLVPRQPIYRCDCIVDPTLSVSNYLIPNTWLWDVQKVRQVFSWIKMFLWY